MIFELVLALVGLCRQVSMIGWVITICDNGTDVDCEPISLVGDYH